MNKPSLVQMSGQFWKLSIEGNNIIMTSTIARFKAQLSFKGFVDAIVRGSILIVE